MCIYKEVSAFLIYLLAVLGLRCYLSFSLDAASGGCLVAEVPGLFMVVASLVAELEL